jgi:hypothetical protein
MGFGPAGPRLYRDLRHVRPPSVTRYSFAQWISIYG